MQKGFPKPLPKNLKIMIVMIVGRGLGFVPHTENPSGSVVVQFHCSP